MLRSVPNKFLPLGRDRICRNGRCRADKISPFCHPWHTLRIRRQFRLRTRRPVPLPLLLFAGDSSCPQFRIKKPGSPRMMAPALVCQGSILERLKGRPKYPQYVLYQSTDEWCWDISPDPVTPLMSAGEWVVVAGWITRLFTSATLARREKIFSLSINRCASSCPPLISKSKD